MALISHPTPPNPSSPHPTGSDDHGASTCETHLDMTLLSHPHPTSPHPTRQERINSQKAGGHLSAASPLHTLTQMINRFIYIIYNYVNAYVYIYISLSLSPLPSRRVSLSEAVIHICPLKFVHPIVYVCYVMLCICKTSNHIRQDDPRCT